MLVKIALKDIHLITEEDGSPMSPGGAITDTTGIQESLAEAGLPKPIEVTPDHMNAGYLVLDGEEYVVAANQLGWQEIDAIVVPNMSDKSSQRLHMLRVFMRRERKPTAFAKALTRMLADGMVAETLTRAAGLKKITELELLLDILKAPLEVQKRIDSGALSMQTWKEIKNKPRQIQMDVAGLDKPTLRAARKVMQKARGKVSNAGVIESAFAEVLGAEDDAVTGFIKAVNKVKVRWEQLTSAQRETILEHIDYLVVAQ